MGRYMVHKMKKDKCNLKIGSLANKYRISIISISIPLIYSIVYIAGGSHTALTHLIYIPIIFASYYWRLKGGVVVAGVSSIALGPLMPLFVAPLEMQRPENWILRSIIFIFTSIFISLILNKIDDLNATMRRKDSISPLTGFYNQNALFNSLHSRVKSNKNFSVISIRFTNIEGIEKYVNPNLVRQISIDFIEALQYDYKDEDIFSSGYNEIILLSPSDTDNLKKVYDLIETYSSPVDFGKYKIQVLIKAGVYTYNGSDEDPIDIYNKARIAREQDVDKQYGVYIYDPSFELKTKEIFEITGAMHDALKNNNFYLTYQPIIDLNYNIIRGVETLIRWNREEKNPVSPDFFIKIAEETGLIKDISKYVIEKATDQIREWNEKDIRVNCSINLTAIELLDQDFFENSKLIIQDKGLKNTQFEFELTERVFINKGSYVRDLLEGLRALGFRLSIDDFGTGYNSLVSLSEIPFDILKIDKYFISRITEKETGELVRSIIQYAHEIDKTVVAEGVETQKQFKMLKEMDCDLAQGFYFSKALSAKDFEEYYKQYLQRERLYENM